MGLEELIHQEENIMPVESLSSFIQWLNKIDNKFEKASIIQPQTPKGQIVDENTRRVKNFSLDVNSSSQTNTHWCNFFGSVILNLKNTYERKHKTNCSIGAINEITVLKYGQGGHYEFHTDHCRSIPRTLSVILFLNNDYEGGDLVFNHFNKNVELLRVKSPPPASAIIWPSNFMYPHKVEPITKGIRYSLVSWLL